MALDEKRAITVARFGAARFGATRFNFCPIDTQDLASAPGTAGPHYLWTEVDMPTTTWTTYKE